MKKKTTDFIKAAQAQAEWPPMFEGGSSRVDAWENVVTGLGRLSTDKRVHAEPGTPESAHNRVRWENIYHGDSLSARVANLLPEDETREWIQVRIESDKDEGSEGTRTEDPSKDMQERADIETAVMDKLEELGAQQAIFQARTWARVFGGALILLGAVDGGTDLAEPLDVDKVQTFSHLTVFDRYEWTPHDFYTDLGDPKFGLPKTYRMGETNVAGGVTGSIDSSTSVHETRFLRFDGVMTSRRRKAMNNGWCDPIYVSLYGILRDFGQTWGSIAGMLQDFRVSVWKMRGLVDALRTDNHDAVIDRFRMMNLCKSIANGIPLDAENEEYEKQSTQLAGLPELMDRFSEQVSASTGYPLTLLFGRSAAGLSATGENDVRQYYDKVAASQRINVEPALTRIIELIFASADGPTNGKQPEAWSLKFNPLWQLDDKEDAERRKTQADADVAYINAGVLSADEVATSRFGGDEYSIETMLDLQKREEEANQPEVDPMEERLAALEAANAQQVPPQVPGTPDPEREDNFRRRGTRDYVVTSNTGAVIGRHTTRAAAQRQVNHILESQGVIVERLSASEWIVVNAEGDIIGVHATRKAAASQVDEILERVDSADLAIEPADMPIAYYAHPMETYGSDVEAQDIKSIEEQGYRVINPNDPRLADSKSMEPFLELVRGSDVVFARGNTPGVNYEVHEARKNNIAVHSIEGEE